MKEENCSEDSESLHTTDLEYETQIKVLMSDGTWHSTSILASTPWGDFRTKLFAQFKISPSTHMVDFTSDATLNRKRIASCPIGKMNLDYVLIKEKNSILKPNSVQSITGSGTENTVRLIVRLARFRQNVLRVNPDVPLHIVFGLICEKLKFDIDAKKRHYLQHPTLHDVVLNLEKSLNDYALREVYLAEKPDENVKSMHGKAPPPPPTRTKRKAPLPPSASISSNSEIRPAEPPTEEVQKKTKTRKRAAPAPPKPDDATNQSDSKPDTAEDEDVPLNQESISSDAQHVGNIVEEVVPIRPPRRQKHSKTSTSDEVKNAASDDVRTSAPDDVRSSAYDDVETFASDDVRSSASDDGSTVQHDVTLLGKGDNTSEMSVDSRNAETNDNFPISSEGVNNMESPSLSPVVFNSLEDAPCSEKSGTDGSCGIHSDANDDVDMQPKVDNIIDISNSCDKRDSGDDGCTNPVDEVLNEFDDIIEAVDDVTNDAASLQELQEGDRENISTNATTYGDIIIYDVSENGDIVTESDFNEVASDHDQVSNSIPNEEPVQSEICFDDLPPPPPAFLEASNSLPTSLPGADEQLDETNDADDSPDSSLPGPPEFEENLPPPIDKRKEFIQNDPHGPVETDDVYLPDEIQEPLNPDSDPFENNEQETLTNVTSSTDVANNVCFDKENRIQDADPPSKAKDPSKMTESEKTALEIEKLHIQIKKMKTRNSVKQDNKDFGRNRWLPGTKSFTFVPASKLEVTHDDFKVAPVPGIELSNNGEIKTLHRDESKEKVPSSPKETYKTHSTLPSYYKRFLDMNTRNGSTK